MLLLAGAALAQQSAPDNWKFSLDGYYRARGFVFAHLYEGQAAPGTYFQHRVRLTPQLNFEERAKFFMTIDGLDGVVWGDNQSMASTALFAGDPSFTGAEGKEVAPIQLERVWTEFKVPVGLVRVGRQASNWGMGLLANDGNGLDNNLFGENKFGSTYDRVIFATRPVTVVTTVASMVSPKAKPFDFPLITAVGVDRLVEDPLIQYYGYSCAIDNPDDGCPPLEEHGLTEERDEDRRTDSWWVDNRDDVFEMIYVVMYKNDGQRFGKQVGDVTLGTYIVNRMQAETDSNVLIIDGYGKLELAGVVVEGEALTIQGETKAITLGEIEKSAGITGWVARGGYQTEVFTLMMEGGYASGDDDVTDADFTGRPLHPDHNVGLLLYEEILSRVTADRWSEDARGLWSNGGVYNSHYIFPNVRFRPMKGWELVGAFLMAWPDEPDGSIVLCGPDDRVERIFGFRVDEGCSGNATSDMLGWEVDVAVKHRWADHMNFTLEAGHAHVTDRLPLEGVGLNHEVDDDGNPYGNYFTVQSRIAYEF